MNAHTNWIDLLTTAGKSVLTGGFGVAVATGLYKIFLKMLEMRQDGSKRGQDQEDKIRSEQAARILHLEQEAKERDAKIEGLIREAAQVESAKDQANRERQNAVYWETQYKQSQTVVLAYNHFAWILATPEGKELLSKYTPNPREPPPDPTPPAPTLIDPPIL